MTATGSGLDARFAAEMGVLLGPDFPSDIALAVSGGGDSMAMLTLAHNWTRVWGLRLHVVTIDHGLRQESAEEARFVGQECAALGHPHSILRWRWDGRGNLMAAAREARLRLIEGWRGPIAHVLFAHTEDDLAETFLARLARGAGVEGLSAMAPKRPVRVAPLAAEGQGVQPAGGEGYDIIRPCLGMRRAELRHYLSVLKGRWVEDPTNEDPRYDRARYRGLLPRLAEEWLGPDILAEAARRQSRARDALTARALEVWGRIGAEDTRTGDITFDRDGLAATERDTQLRLLSAALSLIGGTGYRPREAPLEQLLDRLLSGGSGTLNGCEAMARRDKLYLFRELAAVPPEPLPATVGTLWDGRWQLTETRDGAEIAALGETGWAALPEENRIHPHRAARALPALWRDGALLACPALGLGAAAILRYAPFGQVGMGLPELMRLR
ncbi:tRNA lysidine(34) synthetase TilS [Litorisediminicola beolgyonensis]|uniref:tRNA(Ile)-lysidine synthase n=1 Tax=Litorisediminicola beolgyonensis TaxID=1173614 RepID=A0ABW3ZNS5_9RHOB